MTNEQIDVLVVLNDAGEASIPLEIAAGIEAEDISLHVCSFFEPDDETFGVNVEWLGTSTQLDPLGYVRFIRLVRSLDPDIIHIHPNATGSIVRVLLTLTNAQLITTEHNSHSHFGRVKQTINGLTNVLNDIVVANSETTKLSFARWEQVLNSITGTNVCVIHNGVNIGNVKDSQKTGQIPRVPDGFCIGTAGRLVPQKNQTALVRAAAPLIRDHEDVHLVLIGTGELESDLNMLAEELGITENIHFLGYLPKRRDVYAVMSKLDIFAFPSHYEGFGVAVAEAMAVGIPIVANDIPILREVIGDAGVLVDVNETPAFTDALSSLYNDERRRQALGQAGKCRVSQRFPLQRTIDRHVKLYRSLAEQMES